MRKTYNAPDQLSFDAAPETLAVAVLPETVAPIATPMAVAVVPMARPVVNFVAPEVPAASFVVNADGHLVRTAPDGAMVEAQVPAAHRPRVARLVALRDAARAVLHAELANGTVETVAPLRAALNAAYDTFREIYGFLNLETLTASGQIKVPNLQHFTADPGYPLVAALEVVSGDDVKVIEKAAIFTRPVVQPDLIPDVQSPDDALAVSLNQCGRVDVEYMAVLCHTSVTAVLRALDGRVFYNPLAGRHETRDEFLSGHVREKLAAIRALATMTTPYTLQIAALESVQPTDLAATDVHAALGAPWIPASDVVDFLEHLTGEQDCADVTVDADAAVWRVAPRTPEIVHSVRSTRTWGTARVNVFGLVAQSLNQRDVRLTHRVNEHTVLDAVATADAREKQAAIAAEFSDWMWTDADRTARLLRVYNDRYNGIVPRCFDGSHLTFPGMNTAFVMRPHQRNVVWRALVNGNTGMFHAVGSGKTANQAAIAMESRRLGQAKKPAIVTPASVVHQFAREFQMLYPLARLLVVSGEDFTRAETATLIARIATGDYDCVLLSHQAFARLPLSPETRERMLDRQLGAMRAVWEANPGRGAAMARLGYERQIAKLRAEQGMAGFFFEHSGIDLVIYDEAQAVKNIALPTQVLGLGERSSTRAMDMLFKSWYLQERTPRRGTILATGTPIANSFIETYSWQLMLAPSMLAKAGFASVDAWLATFAIRAPQLELAPTGGYRVFSRFSGFKNTPELTALFREVADVVTDAELDFPRPTMATGAIIPVAVPAAPELQEFNTRLMRRAATVRRGGVGRGRRRGGGNMLVLMGEWSKAAVDLRCVDVAAPETTPNKLRTVAGKVATIYTETADQRATQLVFCDTGIPGRDGFSAYDTLRDMMIDAGVAAEEIAFIHDATTARARTRLFRMVRDGVIRVLIGSTEKMGVGVNVQTRAIACHLVDTVWRGCDLLQRVGRVVRQDNMHAVVSVFAYLTEGTSDAYKMQAVERKARFEAQVLKGDPTLRVVEDVDAVVISFATMKAIATGNPRIIERAHVETQLARVERQFTQHTVQRAEAQRDLQWFPNRVTELRAEREKVAADCETRQDTTAERFTATLASGDVVTDRTVFGTRIAEAIKGVSDAVWRTYRAHHAVVGTVAGFTLSVEQQMGRDGFMNVVEAPELVLTGATQHRTDGRLQDAGVHGLTQRVEALAHHMPDALAKLDAKLSHVETERAELERLATAANPYEAERTRLATRLRELNEQLGIGTRDVAEEMEAERQADAGGRRAA